MFHCGASDHCIRKAQWICEDVKPDSRMLFPGREGVGEEGVKGAVGTGGQGATSTRWEGGRWVILHQTWFLVQSWQRNLKPEAGHALVCRKLTAGPRNESSIISIASAHQASPVYSSISHWNLPKPAQEGDTTPLERRLAV